MMCTKVLVPIIKKQRLVGGYLTTRLSSHFTYVPDKKAPVAGPTTKMNMFQAVNNALDLCLGEDESALIFGEDVAFGGVFRCTMNLQVLFSILSSKVFLIFYFFFLDSRKNMVKIVSLTRHCVNRELLVSVLG